MMQRLLTLLFSCTTLFSLEISTGYRKDEIHWNFKDPSLNLFEKTLTSQRTYDFQWIDLKQVTLGGIGRYTTSYDALIKFSFDVSFIVHGQFKERGLFAGYFESPSALTRGTTHRLLLGFGYPLYFCDDDFQFVPLLGVITNAFHLNCQKCVHGHGRFSGPTLGFEWVYCLSSTNKFLGSFDYRFAKFSGQSEKRADHNVATFKQQAFGRGLFCALGLSRSFWEVWDGGFKFTWTDWLTFRKGEIYANVQNGNTLFSKDTPMGPLTWNSFSLEVTINYSF